MTADTPMPADLQQWVARHMPGPATSVDTSWPRSTSQVWRVTSGIGPAYVKISPSRDAFDREVHAYEHAAAAFPPDEVPRMIARDPGRLAILITALAGNVVRNLALPADTEAQVHGQAGRMLRLWHARPEPAPAAARDAVTSSMARQSAEAAACLAKTRGQLSDAEHALVEETASDLPALAAGLPLVYLHGDYSPRNWLWHAETESLGLIDFEMADYGLAVQDMVWLCGALWPTRLDLRDAFLAGYGRELSSAEQRVLLLLTVRLAVSYLTTGLANGDSVLIDRGRKALGDLVRTHV